MYEEHARAFPEVPERRVEELLAALESGRAPTLIDVRGPAERAVSTLPGAIDLDRFEADPALHDQPVVLYCTIGARSGEAARKLRAQGVDAHNLVGSILAWTHAQGPLENAEGPTRAVHVYGATWDLVAEGYTSTW